MPASLLLLLRLRAFAVVRRIVRPGSAKRLVVTLIGAMVFLTWMLPTLLSSLLRRGRTDPEGVLVFGPLILAAVGLMPFLLGGEGGRGGGAGGTGGRGALAFSPAEIDLLFPGPFSRRHLLAYRLATTGAGIALLSVVLSVVFMRFASSWAASLAATLNALVFVQLLSTLVSVVRLRVEDSLYTRARRAALAVLVAGIGYLAWRAGAASAGRSIAEIVREAREGPIVNALLAPFTVFVRALVADSALSLAGWLAAGAAINAGLLLAVFRADADYLEASIAASQRRAEHLRRLRAGALAASLTPGAARRRVPALPPMGGAGPLIWRQATAALRGARTALFMILLGAGVMAVVFTVSNRAAGGGSGSGGFAPLPLVAAVLTWLTFVLAGTFRFDFRGDLDHLDTLKALPVPSVTLAAGQLAVPAVLLGALQAATFMVMGLLGAVQPAVAALGALGVPVATFVWLAADNFVFLLAPTRPPSGAVDFQAVGRQAVLALFKMAILAAAAGLMALAAWAVLSATGSRAGAAIAALLALDAAALGMLLAVAWAFRRLDPSLDLPA
jgi:hypothetical protein